MKWIVAALVLIPLTTWQAADAAQYTDSAFGYSLTYPDSWHTKTWPCQKGMVVLRGHPDDKVLQGGDPPFGGAQIQVEAFPPYRPDWPADTDEYEHLHGLAARTGTIIDEATRGSGTPARVKWTSPTGGVAFTNITTVLRPAGRIFHALLEYQTADPAGPNYEHIFSDVLASLTVSAAATPSGLLGCWDLVVPPELLVPNPAAGKHKPKSALWATQAEPDFPPDEPTPKVAPYLIRPPDLNAPLYFWEQLGLFDSEAECRAGMQKEKQKKPPDPRALRALRHAQCIEEDDLRSRIKSSPWVDTPPSNAR